MKVLKFLGIQPTLTVTGQNASELPDVSCESYGMTHTQAKLHLTLTSPQVHKLNPGCIRKFTRISP